MSGEIALRLTNQDKEIFGLFYFDWLFYSGKYKFSNATLVMQRRIASSHRRGRQLQTNEFASFDTLNRVLKPIPPLFLRWHFQSFWPCQVFRENRANYVADDTRALSKLRNRKLATCSPGQWTLRKKRSTVQRDPLADIFALLIFWVSQAYAYLQVMFNGINNTARLVFRRGIFVSRNFSPTSLHENLVYVVACIRARRMHITSKPIG